MLHRLSSVALSYAGPELRGYCPYRALRDDPQNSFPFFPDPIARLGLRACL